MVIRTYQELLDEFQVPEIPLEFSRDGSVFATETAYNEFRTKSGKFREQDGIPLFLFPNYPRPRTGLHFAEPSAKRHECIGLT